MKNIIIGALSVGAIYLLYMAYKNNEESSVKKSSNLPTVPEEPAFACPEGEVLCDKKPKTCYNPSAKYIVDPCM